MSEMPSGAPSAPGRERGRTSAAVVGLSLVLVAVGFLAGVFTSHAFGQSAGAAVIRPRAGTFPRPGGFGPGGAVRPGGQMPGGSWSGGQGPAATAPGIGQVPGNGGPPEARPTRSGIAFGTITAVKGHNVTVETASGQTINVQVGSSTAIRIVNNGSPADLTKGSTILAVGTRTGTGALQARMINAGDALPGGFRGPGASSSIAQGTWSSDW